MKKKVTVSGIFLFIAIIFAIIGIFTKDVFWFFRAIIICIGVWIANRFFSRKKKAKKSKKKGKRKKRKK